MKASDPSQADIGRLVDLSKKGDKSAYDQLVYLYHERIISYVARMVHDPIEAEDIVQEAFIRAHCNLGPFRGSSTFQTWLYCIARNLTIDAVRRRKRRGSTFSLDAPLDTDEGRMGRQQEDVDDLGPQYCLETSELQHEIHRAIDKLSSKLRRVLVLFQFEGLGYKGIADVLGCPIGTVKSRLFNARLEVAKHLLEAGLMDEEEMQKLYAQRPNLIPVEHKRKYTRRQAPRLPEEGNVMLPVDLSQFDKTFRERMKKILKESAMKTAGDTGLPSKLDPPPGQIVAEFLDANAEVLVGSVRHPYPEGGNLLNDVAEAFRIGDEELRKYLMAIVNHRRDERVKLINFHFDAVEFFQKLVEPAADYDMSGKFSVWAALADLGRYAIAGDYPASDFDKISKQLGVPRSVLVWCAMMYLVKAGEQVTMTMPASLPTDLAEAFAALDQLQAFKFVEHQAAVAILPEELDEDTINEFLTSTAANHPSLAKQDEEAEEAGLKLPEGTTVRQNLAALKWLGAGDKDVIAAIMVATGTTLCQATQIYSGIEAEEPPEEEQEKKGGAGGSGGTVGGKGAGVGGLDVVQGVGAEGGPDDQSEKLRFLVKGHEYAKRGAWSILAKDVLCDRDPLFAPLNDQETCQGWAIRMRDKGIPWIVIGYLLGGKSVNAIQVHFSKPGTGKLVEPSEADAEKYGYLKQLVGFVDDGTIRCAAEGPNKDLDLEHLTSLSGMTHGQMVASLRGNGKGHTSPPPPPPPPPNDEDDRMRRVREILNGSADNARMRAMTADPKWPDIPPDITLTNYAQILKGANVNVELVTQAIYDAYELAKLCEFDVIEQWYADLMPIVPLVPSSPIRDPAPALPPGPGPTTTTLPVSAPQPKGGEMPPLTSVAKGIVAGMNKYRPDAFADVIWQLTGLTIVEIATLIEQREIELILAKQEGVSQERHDKEG